MEGVKETHVCAPPHTHTHTHSSNHKTSPFLHPAQPEGSTRIKPVSWFKWDLVTLATWWCSVWYERDRSFHKLTAALGGPSSREGLTGRMAKAVGPSAEALGPHQPGVDAAAAAPESPGLALSAGPRVFCTFVLCVVVTSRQGWLPTCVTRLGAQMARWLS